MERALLFCSLALIGFGGSGCMGGGGGSGGDYTFQLYRPAQPGQGRACNKCGGRGGICGKCDGTGNRYVGANYEQCLTCDGSGVGNSQCDRCEGAGRVHCRTRRVDGHNNIIDEWEDY